MQKKIYRSFDSFYEKLNLTVLIKPILEEITNLKQQQIYIHIELIENMKTKEVLVDPIRKSQIVLQTIAKELLKQDKKEIQHHAELIQHHA